jgi:hypothetical protein
MTTQIEIAREMASAIIASGSVTLLGQPAHDAAVLTRYQDAHLIIDRAIMAQDGWDAEADAQRQLYRDCIASLRSRIGE